MFSKYKRKILISVAFGGIVFLLISFYADFSKLATAFGKFNWWWFPVILGLSFLNYIFRFYKWQYYLSVLNLKVKTSRSLLIFFSSFVLSVTPGKMGEILKSYLLREENGTPVSKSMPIVLAERVTDFISVVILSIIGAFVFDYGKEIILIVGLFFIGFTLLIGFRKPSLWLINKLGSVKILKKYTKNFLDAYESTYQLLKIKPLLIATFISFFAWFAECIGLFLVLDVFSKTSLIEVNVLIATFIYGFSTLIGAIAMLPGGLGVTEASITGLLVLLKIPKDISAASTIIIRIATLWFAVLLGIVAVLIYEKTTDIKNLEELVIGNNREKTDK